jgi:predicted HAD superfamily Cof-like phosphohydrolase
MSTIHLVRQFHEAFGHPVEDSLKIPHADVRLLRFRLLLEEVLEFGRAVGVAPYVQMGDEEFQQFITKTVREGFYIDEGALVLLEDAADALGDIDYVCQGANLCFGFPAEDVVAEIHRANMSKLGEDGRPIKDASGRVVKGPNFTPPDIAAVIGLVTE